MKTVRYVAALLAAVLLARPMGFGEEEFYADDVAALQTAPQVKFSAKA